jgi:hypothetical protein
MDIMNLTGGYTLLFFLLLFAEECTYDIGGKARWKETTGNTKT